MNAYQQEVVLDVVAALVGRGVEAHEGSTICRQACSGSVDLGTTALLCININM